jgi:hypothetical protein
MQISGIRPLSVFNLTSLPEYAYNTSYSIRVSVCVNGVWQCYGPACTVTTPNTLSSVNASQCGTTLTCLNQNINANVVGFIHVGLSPLPWRFRVTDLTYSSGTQIISKALSVFKLTDLTAPVATYGTTYSVEVAFLNTDNTWSNYGPICTITTPPFPTTQLVASKCGYTIISGSENIAIASVSCASVSKYQVRLTNTVLGYSSFITRILPTFNLNMFTGLAVSTTYNVEIRCEIGGVYGPWGPICTLTTSNPLRILDDKDLVTRVNGSFDVINYPNPFTETSFLKIESESDEAIQIYIYDMIGKLIERKTISSDTTEIEIGANYNSGVFNIIVTQGENNKNIRIIKR